MRNIASVLVSSSFLVGRSPLGFLRRWMGLVLFLVGGNSATRRHPLRIHPDGFGGRRHSRSGSGVMMVLFLFLGFGGTVHQVLCLLGGTEAGSSCTVGTAREGRILVVGVAFGVGQCVQQVQVFGRLLRELSGGWQRSHDRFARPAVDRPCDQSRVAIGDTNVAIGTPNGPVVGCSAVVVIGIRAGCTGASDRTQQTSIPFAHNLHGDHRSSEAELDRLRRRQLEGAAQVQVRAVGRSSVGEDEFPVLELD